MYEQPQHEHKHETLEDQYLCEIRNNVLLPVPLVILTQIERLAHSILKGQPAEFDDDAEREATQEMIDWLHSILGPAHEQAEQFARNLAEQRQGQIDSLRN